MGLVEVVIAVGLLVTLAAGVVHLFAMSARSVVRSRHRTSSLMLAVDKIEQLRAGVGTTDPAAGPDTQTEYLDIDGRLQGRAGTPPSGSIYARMWSVGELPGSSDVLIVWVAVAPIRAGAGGRASARTPEGARLVTLLRVP